MAYYLLNGHVCGSAEIAESPALLISISAEDKQKYLSWCSALCSLEEFKEIDGLYCLHRFDYSGRWIDCSGLTEPHDIWDRLNREEVVEISDEFAQELLRQADAGCSHTGEGIGIRVDLKIQYITARNSVYWSAALKHTDVEIETSEVKLDELFG